ncbi:MAG: hypothetical protein EBS05_22055, partial [Proteobacteria bacterium]|nr:hypothetical protein [Pseudomonadota bacterium]
SPASYRGVPPRVPAGGETPPELAGEDACGTKPTGRFMVREKLFMGSQREFEQSIPAIGI